MELIDEVGPFADIQAAHAAMPLDRHGARRVSVLATGGSASVRAGRWPQVLVHSQFGFIQAVGRAAGAVLGGRDVGAELADRLDHLLDPADQHRLLRAAALDLRNL